MKSRIFYLLTAFTMIFGSLTVTAEMPDAILREPVSLHCQSTPLRNVLNTISGQIPISFVFRDELVENILVSYHIRNGLLKDVLTYLLPKNRLSYKLLDDGLIVLIPRDIKRSGRLIEQFLRAPKLINRCEPAYPARAIQQYATGLVRLRLLINNQGDVDTVRLKSSSGFIVLDSAAVDYASTLRFTPAIANNQPVPIWMEWEFDYRFSDMEGASKMITPQ